jgi:hypothetical protein
VHDITSGASDYSRWGEKSIIRIQFFNKLSF